MKYAYAVNCGIHLLILIGMASEERDDWVFTLMLVGGLIACVANGILVLWSGELIRCGSLIAAAIGALLVTIGLIALSVEFWPVCFAVVVYLALQSLIMFLALLLLASIVVSIIDWLRGYPLELDLICNF